MIYYKNINYKDLVETYKKIGAVNFQVNRLRAFLLLKFLSIFFRVRSPNKDMSRIKYSLLCISGVLVIVPILFFGHKLFDVVAFCYQFSPQIKKISNDNRLIEIALIRD
jgi:hypothetical protein